MAQTNETFDNINKSVENAPTSFSIKTTNIPNFNFDLWANRTAFYLATVSNPNYLDSFFYNKKIAFTVANIRYTASGTAITDDSPQVQEVMICGFNSKRLR